MGSWGSSGGVTRSTGESGGVGGGVAMAARVAAAILTGRYAEKWVTQAKKVSESRSP